jgi:hypothetical protein
MKIPERLKDSGKSQKFRETQPMCVAYKLIDLDNLKLKEHQSVVIEARVFWPNSSNTCRAVVWIRDEKGGRYSHGIGVAGGSGYHHESTAIMAAFEDMGIMFEGRERFDGVGTAAQAAGIKKIGEALGYENTLLVDFNP